MPKKYPVNKLTLNYAMIVLRELHKKGEIQTLSEQHLIINTSNRYTYVSFKIPYITPRLPLEPFQKQVVKLYKPPISKKEDYNELMNVMKNLRPKDRQMILSYIKKVLPGENKISNVKQM